MPTVRKAAATKLAKRRPAKSGRRVVASKPQNRPTKTTPSPRSGKARGAAARPTSKQAIIVALLQRSDGAPINELTSATGWQAHSVRAALTGLRKQGRELTRIKDATGTTRYRLPTAG